MVITGWAALVFIVLLAVLFVIEQMGPLPTWTSTRWFFRMIRDVAVYGWTNRSFGLAAMILVLIGIGLIIGAAAVSAPWIYTLF
jgi:hypothetical protein